MITNYNKFNIDESIYTEKDINDILDKGFLNFDESDFAVLNSYATDDKELKELLKKIKSYREPFEKLNVSLKDEKGIKKQECFRKWLELHEELSELEKELKYKFKIEDLKKLGKLRESLSFVPNYKYNSITVGPIINKEEVQLVGNIIKQFCSKYHIEEDMVSEFFNHLKTATFSDPIYVRLNTSDYMGRLVAKWGSMLRLKDNDMTGSYTYENLTIKDLQKGALDNIMKYDTAFPSPSYSPKKMDRTLESNNNSDVYKKKLSYSKYNPLVVRINDQEDKDYFFNLVGWYGVFPEYNLEDYPIGTDYILTLKEATLGIEPFRIGYADDYTYYDSGDLASYNPNIYPKLLSPGDLYYVLKELLGIPDAKSMYSPKKMTHSTDEGVSYWPYRFKTREEFEKQYGREWETQIQLIPPGDVGVSWAGDMDYLLGQPCEIEDIDITANQRYYLDTDKIDRGFWIITREMLVKNKQIEPSYAPRKIDRTLLEAKENDITIKKLIDTGKRFVIKCWKKDWFIVEKELLRSNIKWIRNEKGVSLLGNLSNTLERYPYIFFEVSKDGILTWADPSEYNSHDVDITLDTEDTIKKFFNVAPSYAPRKFVKTLEAKESEKYKFLVVEIKNEEEYERAQQELLDQDFYWITDSRVVQKIGRNERFPVYLFIIGENSRYYKNQFFYETKDELEDGNVETTILRRQEQSKKEEICPKVFGIGDVKNIKRLFNYQIAPTYTPRKFNKTFEGFLFEALDKDTTEISIIIKNEKDNERVQKDLFQLGFAWGMTDKYVHLIKEGLDQMIISFYPGNKQIVWCSSVAEFEHFKNAGWRYNSTIYTIDDWTKIMNFLRYGNEGPSYAPRKINRTLESNEWYPYRVKTQKELEEEFGLSWREDEFEGIGWSDVDEDDSGYFYSAMDRFLGKDFPYTEDQLNDKNFTDSAINGRYEGWAIHWDMLTPNEPLTPKAPSYKPRKFNRTLENLNEAFRFISDNRDLTRLSSKPKFLIGDVVTIKPNGLRIHLGGIEGKYAEMDHIKEWIGKHEGKKLTIASLAYQEDYDLWVMDCVDEENSNNYVQQDALTKFAPSYKPRHIDRTLESTDFEQSLIKKIQSVLTPDLLNPEWAKKLEEGKHHPFAGHCYAASEALYHLLGGKEKGYKPMRGKSENGETHWWLQDKNGNKLDPTAQQFYFVGLKPPYENGKGNGFLTKNPSKRAKEIISKISNI